VQYFVARGWCVAAPNYRGSRGYGRAYREALNGNWGVYDVDDSAALVEHLAAKGLVNSSRHVHNG
jgi:dipeptidyl aminopeptidase/acylaminoacyl peptidase